MNRITNIFFDIETYGGKNQPSLEDISAPSNYKDPEKIQAYKESKLDDAWAKQALDPLKLEVICISYAVNDEPTKSIIRGDEKSLLERFGYLISSYDYVKLIGHNVFGFDFPVLYLRALKYKLYSIRHNIPEKRNDNSLCYDTMQAVSSTLYGKDSYMSLKNVASFFGIECKTGMDGSMVHQAYLDGKIKDIATYCEEDVNTVRKIFNILNPDIK